MLVEGTRVVHRIESLLTSLLTRALLVLCTSRIALVRLVHATIAGMRVDVPNDGSIPRGPVLPVLHEPLRLQAYYALVLVEVVEGGGLLVGIAALILHRQPLNIVGPKREVL